MSGEKVDAKKENAVDVSNRESEDEAPQGRNRRSGGKRVSTLTRTAQEGEALLKGLGHKEESGTVEVENRRRTRSSTRGVPPTPPPPAKREKKTPPSGGRGSRRGRPKRDEEDEKPKEDGNEQEASNDAANDKSDGKSEAEEAETEKKELESETKMEVDDEKPASTTSVDEDLDSSQKVEATEGAPSVESTDSTEVTPSEGIHKESSDIADNHSSAPKESSDVDKPTVPLVENNQINDENEAPSSDQKTLPTIPGIVTPMTDGTPSGMEDSRKLAPTITVQPPSVENKITSPTTPSTASTEEGKQTAVE